MARQSQASIRETRPTRENIQRPKNTAHRVAAADDVDAIADVNVVANRIDHDCDHHYPNVASHQGRNFRDVLDYRKVAGRMKVGSSSR